MLIMMVVWLPRPPPESRVFVPEFLRKLGYRTKGHRSLVILAQLSLVCESSNSCIPLFQSLVNSETALFLYLHFPLPLSTGIIELVSTFFFQE